MGSPLRVATYNPLSMLQAGRQDGVLEQFRSVDLLAVVGTCCKTELQVEQSQIANKTLYRLGRGDRNTGIDLYINTRRFGKGAVRSVESLSGRHKGRALAIHIKTRIYDIMLCAFYLPPGERKKDTDDVINWVSERVDKCGHRCLPLLCCDANAHVGFSSVPGVAVASVRTTSSAIGKYNPARENYQGHVLRHFAERHFLALSNTFFWNTPTFYGVTGNTRIDYILCPRAFLPHISSVQSLEKNR